MIDLVIRIHAVLAIAAVLSLPVGVVWGVVEYARGNGVSRAYDRALWTVQILLLVQVGAGVWALLAGREPTSPWHIVYGSIVTVLPFAVFLLSRHDRRVSLYLGMTCAAMLAAAARAVALQT
jgi:hypothetical protein